MGIFIIFQLITPRLGGVINRSKWIQNFRREKKNQINIKNNPKKEGKKSIITQKVVATLFEFFQIHAKESRLAR